MYIISLDLPPHLHAEEGGKIEHHSTRHKRTFVHIQSPNKRLRHVEADLERSELRGSENQKSERDVLLFSIENPFVGRVGRVGRVGVRVEESEKPRGKPIHEHETEDGWYERVDGKERTGSKPRHLPWPRRVFARSAEASGLRPLATESTGELQVYVMRRRIVSASTSVKAR